MILFQMNTNMTSRLQQELGKNQI